MLHWLAALASCDRPHHQPPVRDQTSVILHQNLYQFLLWCHPEFQQQKKPRKKLTEIIQCNTMIIYSELCEDYLIMNVSRKYFQKLNKNVGYFIMLKLVLQQSIRVSYGSQIFPKYFYDRQKKHIEKWKRFSILFIHLIVSWQQRFFEVFLKDQSKQVLIILLKYGVSVQV